MIDAPAVASDAVGHRDDGLYARLVESSPDVIYRLRTRPEVRMEYINPAAERILGYPMETLMSADLDFLLSMYVEDERHDVREVAEGRRFYHTTLRRMRRGDGNQFWAELHNIPIYDESGHVVAHEGTLRDVTARQDALDKLRVITEALPELLFRIGDSGKLVEQIPTASRQPARLFLGKTLEEVVSEECRIGAGKHLSLALAGTSSSFRCDIDVFGEERTYEIRLLPCGSGELLAFLRDMTSEVWAEAESRRRVSRDDLESRVEGQIGINNRYNFTFREFAVLHLVARGLTDKQIGAELGVVPSTVGKHVSNILGKMGAASRTDAGVRAVKEGLAPG